LGFSGNGRMEPALADLVAEIDAAVYVLDCLPNMDAGMVAERVEPFVRALRRTRDQPIVLVENIVYQTGWIEAEPREAYLAKNAALRAAHAALVGSGIRDLHYVAGEALLGDDGEGTVDGVHPTDLGFTRMAAAIAPALRAAL